jgi:hypothetical protein
MHKLVADGDMIRRIVYYADADWQNRGECTFGIINVGETAYNNEPKKHEKCRD